MEVRTTTIMVKKLSVGGCHVFRGQSFPIYRCLFFSFFAQIYPTSAVYPSFEGNVIEAGKFKISRAATWRSY